jgi:predicted AlkP superfamily phosphohydrolase/phosphomutase
LRQSGAWGILESTKPPVTPVAWVSFQTGCTPDVHGVLNFIEFNRKTKTLRPISSSNICVPTIWEVLFYRGKRVISVNVPVTYPPKPINGFMLTGLLTPSQKSKYYYPDSLRDELHKNNLFFEVHENIKFLKGMRNVERFIQRAINSARKNAEIFKYLVTKKTWELAMIHFQVVDTVQHAYYCYLDESHPNYNNEKYQIVKTFYIELDKIIKSIIEILPDNCNIAVISDHGFYRHLKHFYINNWLREKKYLVTHSSKKSAIVRSIFMGIRKLDKFGFRNRLVSRATRIRGTDYELSTTIDFKNSRIIAQAISSYPYIYLIDDDKHMKDLLIEELMTLKDPSDSSKIFERCIELRDFYKNWDNSIMPDLLLVPSRGITCKDKLSSDGLFSPIRLWKDTHIGTHREEGIYLFCGKHNRQGCFRNSSISDIVPTILYLMQEPIPQFMNGNVIEEIIDQDYKKKVKVSIDSTLNGFKRMNGSQLKEDEAKSIEENLKNLGYMD